MTAPGATPDPTPDRTPVDVTTGAARDTAWTLATYTTRALGSLLFVLATSHALGASAYGSLAALSSLTSLGVALLVSGVARATTQIAAQHTHDPDATVTTAIRTITIGCAAVVVPFSLGASLLPGITITAAASLFIVDVALTGTTEAIASRHVGRGRFTISTALLVPMALGRIAAATTVWTTGVDTVAGVCLAALGGGALAFVAALAVHRATRHTPTGAGPTADELVRTGAVYTAGNLVTRASNDLDKVYLNAMLSGDPRVGSYAIAARLAEYAGIPMTALSAALSPRLFRAGVDGETAAHQAGRRLRTRYLVTGIATTLAVAAAAPIAHLVFDASYTSLTAFLLALAPLPLVRAYSNSLAEPFTGAGRHHVRVRVWVLGLAVNVVVNLALVPGIGVTGALVATYATEAAQIVAFSRLRRRHAAAA